MFEERKLKFMTLEEVMKLCVSIKSCNSCPLRDEDGFCRFQRVCPSNWRLD